MSLWRETCQHLRRAVVTGDRICLSQSKRYLNTSTPLQASRIAQSSRFQLNGRGNIQAWTQQRLWQGMKPSQRSFSVTAGVQHGHITPPKPGEE
ncbi:hypothetical protein AWENTII_002634 [Aspergillus wentii]